MTLSDLITLSEGSRRLGRPAKAISDAIARGAVSEDMTVVVGGRRMLPARNLPAVRKALETDRRRKKQSA